MSSPGFFYGDTDPAYTRQMQMAQALMGNNANPKTANAGLANMGSDIAGAFALRNAQNQQQGQNFANQRMMAAGDTPVSFNSPLFSFGGK